MNNQRDYLGGFTSSSETSESSQLNHRVDDTDIVQAQNIELVDGNGFRNSPMTQPYQPNLTPSDYNFIQRLNLFGRLLASPIIELFEIKNATKFLIQGLLRKLAEKVLLRYKCIKIRQEMDKCITYKEYEYLGSLLDKLQGKEVWKQQKECHLYDYVMIEQRLNHMRRLRESKDIQGLVFTLRQDLQKNIGGICNPNLYNICKIGTKQLIEDYHNETIKCIQMIYYYKGSKLDLQDKLEFFSETRHSYGRTALFLSGGASFGKFHMGVCKALYEHDLFPRVIAGSSAGSLIACLMCSRPYSELHTLFNE